MSHPLPTALNHYRLLGRSGLRVSPLCLGAMTFGTEWNIGADKEDSRKVFEHYVERGGNFIDTANFYTAGTSEQYLGEFTQGRRDQFVVATKFTLNMRQGDPNAGGNHRKCLVQSLEASLRRLKTDYIDLYWVHNWEWSTPVEETMRALDDMVRAGKVLYIGISDMPAWKVAQANTLADARSWTPFIANQIEYSLIERTPERDLMPMSVELNLGVTPWSPLAGGLLSGKYSSADRVNPDFASEDTDQKRRGMPPERLTDRNLAIADEVKLIAEEIGQTPSQVALNWLLQQPGVASPIIGARTVKQLDDNLGSLDFALDAEQMKRLNNVSKIELGFPHDFLASDAVYNVTDGGTIIERH